MTIIKLTQKDLDIEDVLNGIEDSYKYLETFINTKNIVSFAKSEEGSYVYLVTRELEVKETPEEILALIKEAENESLSGL